MVGKWVDRLVGRLREGAQEKIEQRFTIGSSCCETLISIQKASVSGLTGKAEARREGGKIRSEGDGRAAEVVSTGILKIC